MDESLLESLLDYIDAKAYEARCASRTAIGSNYALQRALEESAEKRDAVYRKRNEIELSL